MDGVRRVHLVSSLLPRPILSVEDRFFAKAMAMVEAVVLI